MSYSSQLLTLRNTILNFSQEFKTLTNNARNASKLENKTLDEIVQLISGATNSTLAEVETALNTFIARNDNPHQVTKVQVGLGSLQNFAVATNEEALNELNANTYMTPQRVWEALMHFWASKVGAAPETLDEIHEIAAALQNNPDIINVIQDQVALKATKVELNNAVATINQGYVDADAALSQLISETNTRINALTKADVGLGLVQNFGVATNQEAVDGVVDNKYMTPAKTKAVRDEIEANVSSALTSISQAFADAIAVINTPVE